MTLQSFAATIARSPLSTIYFYGGNSRREGVYTQGVVKGIDLLLSIFRAYDPTLGVARDIRQERARTYVQLRSKTISLIEIVDTEFLPEKWNPKTTLLWLPGAEATHLDQQLAHKVEQLKAFWEKGGAIFSVCGSAYWCSAVRVYGNVLKESRSPFFPVTSIGPRCSFPDAPLIKWEGISEPIPVFLKGGGSFVVAEGSDVEVLARYQDTQEPVAIKQRNAVLTHVHLEYNCDEDRQVSSFADQSSLSAKLSNKDSRVLCLAKIIAAICIQKHS